MSSDQSPIILAYSGGLDTSFCVPWLKASYGRDVITATIDTGGIDASAAEDLAQRALALGAIEHVRVDARESFFDDVIRHLIAVAAGVRQFIAATGLDNAEIFKIAADAGLRRRQAARR